MVLLFFRFSFKSVCALVIGVTLSTLVASFFKDVLLNNIIYYGGLMVTFYFFITRDVDT
jgi:hypothetical protein